METFVYEDTPLADYLEGSGEGAEEWTSQEAERPTQSPVETPTLNFAPRGRPKFQDRIRNKLPAPLQLDTLKKRETIAKLQGACSAAVSARIGKSDNERFLEQFGYIIVASQLLNEQPAPSYNTVSESLANAKPREDVSLPPTSSFDLQGAVITAGASFIIVWLLHWSRSRHGKGWDLRRILVSVLFLSAIGVAFYALTRRQWLKYLRRQAVDVGTVLVGNAQTFDSAAAASVVLIQEVELVSRGYRLSTPLPPVTRLEEQTQTRRCLRLRKVLSDSLSEMLRHYLDAKRTLRPLTDTTNLEKYYDIYGFTQEELRDAEATLVDTDNEERTSLRSLRVLFNRVYSARKGTLCCLLALPADGGGSDIAKWNTAVEVMQKLATTSGTYIQRITDILNEQDREMVPQSPRTAPSPGKEQYRARLRRLNSLSQGIRSLHAKMHLIREESGSSFEGTSENANATLMTLYESIGADLRGLLQEWEVGKSALLASLESPTRFSRPPSMLKSPSSTTSDSLDGATAVEGTDGSPAAALRALTGEDDNLASPDCNMDDSEVFEAIAIPRKRNSMTREERIARMKEDRAKHAAARERMDANTNMLKELETVIKLRPQGPKGQRVTSLAFKMLEARLEQASLLKKIIDAIKDLVQDCNFDCNDSGIALQAMDNSHVALVSMILKAEGFSPYRCDRNIALGINLTSLTKVLRAAQNEDILTLKAEDSPDVINLVFESADTDRLSEYDIKLMDIDQEHLAIPETEYAATVEMPSTEFRRICGDLMNLSESVLIEATKEGVKFSCNGEIGNGSVTLRQHTNVDKPDQNVSIDLSEPVALTFSLKYLSNFCKATALSTSVRLCLSQEVPLLVEYNLGGGGHLRFFLAPKIGDEE